MTFRRYQHLERFGTTEVQNIELGECYIFPKIDGTNSSVWIENGEIKADTRFEDFNPVFANTVLCDGAFKINL